MTLRLPSALALVVTLLATSAGCTVDQASSTPDDEGSVVATTEDLSAAALVAWSSPAGMRQSTGNLYWTQNSVSEFGNGYTGRVYRAAKTNTPGNETILYAETSPDPVSFGALTYANPGTFYGYFVVNYASYSQIKRVPLAGGAATVIATSPMPIGSRQAIESDGTYLYWADSGGARRVALGGGAVTTLASLSDIAGIGVDHQNLYIGAGTTVWSMNKTGGLLRVLDSTQDTITSMSVAPDVGYLGGVTVLAWGQRNGVIMKQGYYVQYDPTHQPAPFVVLAPGPGWTASSVSEYAWNAQDYLGWTLCATPGNSPCYAYAYNLSGRVAAGVGAGHVQADPNGVYWGNVSAVERASR